ncbi:MAG: 3-oxoacid CoA-transferase subunit B [Chloroflexi bacterium]|nr:3-oxoacid CoA-transferase subunit B [Chloroflexota bacterium]
MTAQRLDRETLALRVAREFEDGDVVNLGIGIPTLAANYIPEGRTVLFHTENGAVGFGPFPAEGEEDIHLTNAGGGFVTPLPGMSIFDSVEAFTIVRGGYLDITVLGAMQVSETGDLANWLRPGRVIGGIGGAMDIVAGATRVIAAMEHTDKQGNPKIVKRCTLPLTAVGCVDTIITDMAVIAVTSRGLVLLEHAPGLSPQEIQAATEATLIISPDLKEIEL